MKTQRYHITLLVLLFSFLSALTASAQPQKVRQAALTLTTYRADGTLLATAPAVFVGKDGTALSAWEPFRDAARAEVKDAQGRTLSVACLYGASSLYNVARFRVDGTPQAVLTPSATAAKAGTKVYVMGRTTLQTAVSTTETFEKNYTYTVLESITEQPLRDEPSAYNGAAVVTDKGELLGLYAYSATGQSATDARYANAFQTNALSTSDATLMQTRLRLALPPEQKDAQLALMLALERGGDYQLGAATDYMTAFPTAVDGYYQRANALTDRADYAEAERTMQQCLQRAADKAEAHYDYSRLVTNYLTIVQPADTVHAAFAPWTWALAEQEARAAVAAQQQSIYRQQVAETVLGQQRYEEALQLYQQLANEGELRGEPYYKMALCRSALGATAEETLPLLTQAIEKSDTAMAATYFYARAVTYDALGRYREAMRDYIVYENLDFRNLTSAFYYQREQCERNGKFWQPALDDIAHAVLLSPRNAAYWGEWASLALQLGKHEDALTAADQCLKYKPGEPDALLIRGVALCEQGKKDDGLRDIQAAKDAGNEQAQAFIDKYSK